MTTSHLYRCAGCGTVFGPETASLTAEQIAREARAEQSGALAEAKARIAELERQNGDLQAANNRLLERARAAEASAKETRKEAYL